MEITLRPVDGTNWYAVTQLSVSEQQRSFVASNAFSLAQAAYTPQACPLAIYAGEQPVGFLLYACDTDFDPPMWGLWRLMIDQAHQRKGYGRRALVLLLEQLEKAQGHVPFFTSADPENGPAIALYESMGFHNTGKLVEGELLLIRNL